MPEHEPNRAADDVTGHSRSDSPSDASAGSSATRAYVSPGDVSRGSTAKPSSPAAAARLDSQPTVISKQPPGTLTPPFGHLNPAEMGRLLQGQTLGHYELIEFVGGGGMGAVFRALDTMLNRTVAVKVLSHEQSADEETLRRFKNEAQSAARLDHENIGRVHYVGEDNGWHYIVFEFIEGINLRDLVDRDGPLSLSDAVSYMLQLGDALAHASRRDVVHRDIKPSNVLITPDGKAKLVDMGLARLHQVEHANNDLTASGVTLGTFDYISPEQARDPRNADVRSDLYSLGCTCYFMVTGRPPFPTGTVLQKLLQHQGDAPPNPKEFCPELPEDLCGIILKLLSKSPDDRYQQPSELVAELTAVAVRLGLRPASPGSMIWLATAAATPSSWERNLPWLAPVAALVVIVLLLNLIWSAPSDTLHPSLLGRFPAPESRLKSRAADANEINLHEGQPQSPLESKRGKEAKTRVLPPAEPTSQVANSATATANSGTWDRLLEKSSFHGRQLMGQMWTTFVPGVEMAIKNVRENYRLPVLNSDSNRRTDTTRGSASATEGSRTGGGTERRREHLVTGRSNVPGEYATLGAAVRKATSGDVIELRFDGPLDEEPLRISNLKLLTIRAGAGFEPVIRFRARDAAEADSASAMVVLRGGTLYLHNVRLEYEPPQRASGRLSFFELTDADEFHLQDSSVTVRSLASVLDRPAVDVIRVTPGVASSATNMMKETAPRKPVRIDVKRSIVRGEANFIRSLEGEAVDVNFENSVAALSERFLDADVSLRVRSTTGIAVRLSHATVLGEVGFLRLDNASGAVHSLAADVSCFDSILIGGGGATLLEQASDEQLDLLRSRVKWRGGYNFYEGFAVFWRLPGQEIRVYEEWAQRWSNDENMSTAGEVGWVSVRAKPMHALVAEDFELMHDSAAQKAALDGKNAGAAIELLPRLVDATSAE